MHRCSACKPADAHLHQRDHDCKLAIAFYKFFRPVERVYHKTVLVVAPCAVWLLLVLLADDRHMGCQLREALTDDSVGLNVCFGQRRSISLCCHSKVLQRTPVDVNPTRSWNLLQLLQTARCPKACSVIPVCLAAGVMHIDAQREEPLMTKSMTNGLMSGGWTHIGVVDLQDGCARPLCHCYDAFYGYAALDLRCSKGMDAVSCC